MTTLTSFDIVVATRLHGILLPPQAERLVLAICYYRKSAEIKARAGQADYGLDLEDFIYDELLHHFRALANNGPKGLVKIKHKQNDWRADLDKQYQEISDLF